MRQLLLWKARIACWNYLRSPQARVGTAVLVLMAGALAVMVFGACRFLFKAVQPVLTGATPVPVAPEGELVLLSALYDIGLLILLVSGFAAAFFALHASSDLPLLLAAPFTVRQIFALKFCELAASQLPVVLVVVLPAACGYGAGVGARWSFYPAALLLSLLFLFLPTALAVLAEALVVRVIPPYRVRELGAALGTLLGIVMYAFFYLGSSYFASWGPQEVISLTDRLSFAKPKVSPAHWLAQATVAASRGSLSDFLFWGGLTAVVSFFALVLSFLLVQEAFYTHWVGAAETHLRLRRRPLSAVLVANRRKSLLSLRGPLWALAGKEMRMICRDLREWMEAMYMLVMMVVVTIAPALRRGGSTLLPPELLLYVCLGVAGAISWALVGPLALGCVAREGRSWSFLRSTPITGEQILKGKIMGVVAPVLAPLLAVTLAASLLLGLRDFRLIVVASFVLLVTPGLAALGAWCGTLSPDFNAQNVRQRVGGAAYLFFWVVSLLYAASLAVGVFFVAAGAWTGWRVLVRALGLLWLVIIGVLAFVVGVVLGGREIERREACVR